MNTQNDLFLDEIKYCFDASSFINLKNFYPKDVFHNVHTQFVKILSSGKICVLNIVLEELEKDTMTDFFKYLKSVIPKERVLKYEDYIYTTQELIQKYYNNKGKTHNLTADPHVIACAKEERIGVVTDEKGAGVTQIPYICNNEQIECISTVDFFRKERCKF